MKWTRILLLFLLTFPAGRGVYGQADLENKVIATLLNEGNKLIPEYKASRKKGWIKKFNHHQVPEMVLLNVTHSPLKEPEFDTLSMFRSEVLSKKDKDMLHDFCQKNRTSLKIDSVFRLEDKISYLRSSDFKKVFPEGSSWHNYYYHYGLKPYVNVSRPGFNQKKNKALIYLTYTLGKNDGAGYYLVMKKLFWKWRIRGNMLIWVK